MPRSRRLAGQKKDIIDQEENSAFELGAKADFGALRLNAAWFDSSVENTQYFPFGGRAFADMARQCKYPGTTAHVTSMSGAAVSPKMTNLEYRAYESCIFSLTRAAALDSIRVAAALAVVLRPLDSFSVKASVR